MKLTCPTADRLGEFLQGTVDDMESEQLSEHIDACSNCCAVLSGLERDQEQALQKIRDGYMIESLLAEPEFSCLRRTAAASRTDASDTAAHRDDAPGGKRLRDYRLVKKIGEGGMGTVYQAIHVHLGKSVALKILPTDKLRSKHSVERFRREMRAVGKVNHPNVVSASDAGTVDGQHFLVMELVEGADLARIIHDRGALNVPDACEIVRQAAIGLQHAHDMGLVHRDVKPSNLMLAIDGTVKLLDLGLAGLNRTDFASTASVAITDQLTSVGQVMGTLDYMAPEQIISSARVDGRADVYALGATLFQLLTIRTPCGDRSADTPERIEAVLTHPPLEITKLRGDLPEGLAALLTAMLAKAPENRPQSASDVAEALSYFVADANLVALADACKTSLDMPSADIDITDDVSFVVSQLHSQETCAPADSPRPQRTWPRHVSIVGLALIALIAAPLLSVFTFRTKSGTVKVDLPDGAKATAVRVALEQDGETVRVIDVSGDWEVSVTEGNYDTRLVKGDDQFVIENQTLTVKSQQTVNLKVTWIPLPDPVAIFTSGNFEQGARAAEQLVEQRPSNGWYHAQAAMMRGAVPLIGGRADENAQYFEKHRSWLAKRWAETGEGANTIPRIVCLRPAPSLDLQGMLEAVTEESAHHPRDWRYPHSRMMLLYRLGNYQEALEAFVDCRRLSPKNRMHLAVDHAWQALILYRLGQIEAGRRAHAASLQLYQVFRPTGQRELPDMWFDFVELGVILNELGSQFELALDGLDSKSTLPIPPTMPSTESPEAFKLLKWRTSSDVVQDAKLAANGKSALFALGWRPGTYELWELGVMPNFLLWANDEHIIRRVEGQPVRSVAFHPTEPLIALGRWYGSVEIVDLYENKIIAHHETGIGKLRKANSVTFTADGRHLLISYHSNRIAVWDWKNDQIVSQKNFPWPVWHVRLSASQDEVLVRGRIWNWRTGKENVLVEDQILEGQWSSDGKSVLLPADEHLRVFDVGTGELVEDHVFETPVKRLVSLDEGDRVITGHVDGTIRLLDWRTGDHILLGQIHANHEIGYMVMDQEQRVLLTATGARIDRRGPKEHQIAIWSLAKKLAHEPLAKLTPDQEKDHPSDTDQRRQ